MTFDTSRLIFDYTHRGAKRFADPTAVHRGLVRAGEGEFDVVCRACNAGDDTHEDEVKRETAKEQLHAVVCSAFWLPTFDPATGEGTTEAETVALLGEFLDWLDGPPASSTDPTAAD